MQDEKVTQGWHLFRILTKGEQKTTPATGNVEEKKGGGGEKQPETWVWGG